MTIIVDARGQACPQPVILTRKAMQQGKAIATLVDSQASSANVARMAEKAGWQAKVTQEGNDYRVEITPSGAVPEPQAKSEGRAEALAGPLVLTAPSDEMGRGDPELGQLLIRAFFHTLCEVQPTPDTIVFFNTGVRLSCEGSPVLDDLRALLDQGIEILSCGTCLGHLGLREALAVGRVSNMYEIAETILRASKVVSL